MATKDTGLSKLTEEQLEELRQIFENERNKNTAWENAKKKIGGLDGVYSFAKSELVKLGIVSEIESLGFTSVEQYRRYTEEQDALPPKEIDKQMGTTKRCPLPVEGVYTDIKGFGKKAKYDREQLLKKANDVAKESRKASLPYIYKHGFAMTYEQLTTLMETYGFSMDSRIEYFTDEKGKNRTKTIEFFVDTMPPEERVPEREHEATGEAEEYDLDRKTDLYRCYKMSVTKKTAEAMDELLESLKEGVSFTKARKSALYELIFASGIASVQKKLKKQELKFVFRQKTSSLMKKTFSLEDQKTDVIRRGGK